MTDDAPDLAQMPVSQIVAFWRPGSHDWPWADEYADLIDTDVTAAVEQRVLTEGFGFADDFAPVLLGSDGRVWDGHHRIILAIKHAEPYLMAEFVEPVEGAHHTGESRGHHGEAM